MRPVTIFFMELSIPANASLLPLACPTPPKLVGVALDWKTLAVGAVEVLNTLTQMSYR